MNGVYTTRETSGFECRGGGGWHKRIEQKYKRSSVSRFLPAANHRGPIVSVLYWIACEVRCTSCDKVDHGRAVGK
jgi:hypothetical protein